VRFEIHRVDSGQARRFRRTQLYLDLTGDSAGDFSLQRQNVLQIALVTSGPPVPISRSVNELSRNAHPVPGPLH
jgi:hypothetical protein